MKEVDVEMAERWNFCSEKAGGVHSCAFLA